MSIKWYDTTNHKILEVYNKADNQSKELDKKVIPVIDFVDQSFFKVPYFYEETFISPMIADVHSSEIEGERQVIFSHCPDYILPYINPILIFGTINKYNVNTSYPIIREFYSSFYFQSYNFKNILGGTKVLHYQFFFLYSDSIDIKLKISIINPKYYYEIRKQKAQD